VFQYNPEKKTILLLYLIIKFSKKKVISFEYWKSVPNDSSETPLGAFLGNVYRCILCKCAPECLEKNDFLLCVLEYFHLPLGHKVSVKKNKAKQKINEPKKI